MGTCASKPVVRDDAASHGEAKEVICTGYVLYWKILRLILWFDGLFGASLRRGHGRGQHDLGHKEAQAETVPSEMKGNSRHVYQTLAASSSLE